MAATTRPAAIVTVLMPIARIDKRSVSAAAATISGDGVSPAASAAASGSPPGSADATAMADEGRRAGSCSRQRRITRSIAGSSRRRSSDGFVGGSGGVEVDAASGFDDRVRRLSGKQLVQHQAERVDVGPRGRALPGELLRRHVSRRAHDDAAFPIALDVGEAREAEVGDPRATAFVDHHVGRLEIAVQHAAVVRRGQSRAHLTRELGGLRGRKPSNASQQRRQIFAVHILHRDERLAVGFADVVDPAHVGVRHLPRDADFLAEPRQPVGIS